MPRCQRNARARWSALPLPRSHSQHKPSSLPSGTHSLGVFACFARSSSHSFVDQIRVKSPPAPPAGTGFPKNLKKKVREIKQSNRPLPFSLLSQNTQDNFPFLSTKLVAPNKTLCRAKPNLTAAPHRPTTDPHPLVWSPFSYNQNLSIKVVVPLEPPTKAYASRASSVAQFVQ